MVTGQSNVTLGSYGYPPAPLGITGISVPPAPAVTPPVPGVPADPDGAPAPAVTPEPAAPATAATGTAPPIPADPPVADGCASLWNPDGVEVPQAKAVTERRQKTKPDRITKPRGAGPPYGGCIGG